MCHRTYSVESTLWNLQINLKLRLARDYCRRLLSARHRGDWLRQNVWLAESGYQSSVRLLQSSSSLPSLRLCHRLQQIAPAVVYENRLSSSLAALRNRRNCAHGPAFIVLHDSCNKVISYGALMTSLSRLKRVHQANFACLAQLPEKSDLERLLAVHFSRTVCKPPDSSTLSSS